MLVENSGHASHLNLRLPHATSDELDAIERWTEEQLRAGVLNWEKLPTQLQRSGDVLRHALEHPSISLEPTTLVHGLSRLVAEPEFQSAQDLGPLLQLIDDEPTALISPGAEARVFIGQEHPQSALEACSVVQAPYRCGQEGTGHVALIGPMRMAYATACSAVERVARHLELLLS
jgi:heat-inducible transcriptional repressor